MPRPARVVTAFGKTQTAREWARDVGLRWSVLERRLKDMPAEQALTKPERAPANNRTKHPLYATWCAMNYRCRSRKSPAWEDYGGRGIAVCARWADCPRKLGFAAFLADMGPRPDGASLDRIDVNGNYEPTNCRWADRKTQNENTRSHRTLRARIAALEAEVARLRASVTRVERRQRGEDPRQLHLVGDS